jgi:hypothetical protein
MADLNALNCLQLFKYGNNETEQHSGVVHDQLDGLSSRRGSLLSAIRKRLLCTGREETASPLLYMFRLCGYPVSCVRQFWESVLALFAPDVV